MQDTIQKLVMLDRKAREQVDEIRESTGLRKEAILQDKNVVYQEYLQKAKRHVDKIRESAAKEELELENKVKENFLESKNQLDSYYAQNKEKWVQEIFERVVRCSK